MKKMLGILMVACVVLSGAAFADSISGKVGSVDATTNTIEVAKTDAVSGAVENVKVTVDAATVYTGVASLADLQAGKEVKIEASKDEASGSLKASSVEVVEEVAPVADAPVADAPAAPAEEPAKV